MSSATCRDEICSEYTFVWKIINLSHCTVSKGEKMESPVFSCYMDKKLGTNLTKWKPGSVKAYTEWKLSIYPRSALGGTLVTSILEHLRCTDDVQFTCHLCVCTTKQELLYEKETKVNWKLSDKNHVIGIGSFERDVFEKLIDDTAVLHLHMCTHASDQSKNSVHYFTETRVSLERNIFEVAVENFSSLQLGEKKACTTLISPSKRNIVVKMFISGRNLIDASVEIRLYYENLKEETFSTCTLWITDKNGTLRKCVEKEYWLGQSAIIESAEKKFSILRHEILFKELPDDILILRGEVTLSGNSSPWEQVVRGLQTTEAVAAAMGPRLREVPYSNPSLPACPEHPPSALSADMRSLLKGDGSPPDFELRVGGRSFPVHRLVLGARSSVFRAMIQEKAEGSLDLTDIDEGTAEMMLLYAYTDEGPPLGLGWESLVDLYAAAHKYAFMGLRSACGQRLAREMDLTNAPIVLQIAVRHKDDRLKKEVIDFFVSRASQGLVAIESENWKKLEQGDAKLANEVLHQIVYKKHQVVADRKVGGNYD